MLFYNIQTNCFEKEIYFINRLAPKTIYFIRMLYIYTNLVLYLTYYYTYDYFKKKKIF